MPSLEENRLFSTLADAEIRLLNESCEPRNFTADQQIFREGDPGDGIYIVLEGSVQISSLVTQEERRVLNTIRAGDFFGEMAVLDGDPRSATATAAEETVTLFIAREKLLDVVGRSPVLALNLLRQ